MAQPYRTRDGVWYARIKDAADRWRSVRLPEAKTKREAQEYQDELARKHRRQRDGLDPMPADRATACAKLRSTRGLARRTRVRFGIDHFYGGDDPVIGHCVAQIEAERPGHRRPQV